MRGRHGPHQGRRFPMLTNLRYKVMTLCFSMMVLLAVSAPAAAQGSRYNVTLYNESDVTFEQVHVSSIHDDSWERDLLGDYVLRPGHSLTVEIPAGRWDFQFKDPHGNSCVLHNVIVNTNADVEVTNEWLAEYCTFQLSRR